MSFVIAISDGEKIVMGADSQVTHDDGTTKHGYKKYINLKVNTERYLLDAPEMLV